MREATTEELLFLAFSKMLTDSAATNQNTAVAGVRWKVQHLNEEIY